MARAAQSRAGVGRSWKPPACRTFAACGITRPPARLIYFLVVSIKQRYPGHARQAGLIATECHAAAYLGRYTVVVDDDIDPTNLDEVLWAVCTRSDPVKDIEILRRCWSGPLDPIIPKDQKGFNSRAIIDATRPYEWLRYFSAGVAIEQRIA